MWLHFLTVALPCCCRPLWRAVHFSSLCAVAEQLKNAHVPASQRLALCFILFSCPPVSLCHSLLFLCPSTALVLCCFFVLFFGGCFRLAQNFLALAASGAYTSTTFHRVSMLAVGYRLGCRLETRRSRHVLLPRCYMLPLFWQGKHSPFSGAPLPCVVCLARTLLPPCHFQMRLYIFCALPPPVQFPSL